MKLAEALSLRADMGVRLRDLADRIGNNLLVQSGDEPAEDPNEMLAQFDRISRDLEDLIVKINRTNLEVTLDDGRSITAAIARRDSLKGQLFMWRKAASGATMRQDRYSLTEVKFEPVISVKDARARVDQLSKALRETDVAIQEANWKFDLME